MKLEVQKYLEQYGIEKLKSEYHITVSDYEDRVVLNYNQIESPKFNPICDECRALILKKGTWEVLAQSFVRFYNVLEGELYKTFPIKTARIDEKLDGSLISVYFFNSWTASTRKMAFAEGSTLWGKTFRQIFDEGAAKTNLWKYLEPADKDTTYVFELTSPENRVVHPYSETSITLIAARSRITGQEYKGVELDQIAKDMNCNRPKSYHFNSLEEAIQTAKSLNVMDEGFVLVDECQGSFSRMKCKNENFVAIAHMRENGGVPSPKNILKLTLNGEKEEYLSYFAEDERYFSFVEEILNESLARIQTIADKCMSIESQKDFALTIKGECKLDFEAGVLFEMRKFKKTLPDIVKGLDAKKLVKSLKVKEKMCEKFGVKIEEDV